MSKYVNRMFPKDVALAIENEDYLPEGYEIVDSGDWIDDGKYSYKETVFKADDGNFYSLISSRSGSYFSDYYYDSEDWGDEVEVSQVEKIAVTKIVWCSIKVEE